MKMNRLGRTDMMVSEICLGTMTWGEQNSEADAHEQMDYALSQGVNFFDAAEMYPTQPTRAETQGRTEEYIGSWFRKSGKRDDVILATKMGGNGVEWIRGKQGFTRASVMEAVDGSLKRLGVDHIDLYQLHWPNRGSYHFRKHWAFDASTQDKTGTVADIHETLEGRQDPRGRPFQRERLGHDAVRPPGRTARLAACRLDPERVQPDLPPVRY